MVMTLRKRAAPPRRSPSPSSSSSESETMKKKPRQVTKKKKNAHSSSSSSSSLSDSGSDSDSDSDSGSDSGEIGYEKFREQRIRENKERMEKLGIFVLSSQVNNGGGRGRKSKTVKIAAVKKKKMPSLFPRPRSYESRRFDRFQTISGGKYLETERSLKDMGIAIPDEWTSEVYTEEDQKLLGNCEKEWTLNVDGFGEDGDRLYDPVNGTSCHQCRQKTSRKHTYCSKCRSPKGQLCGDCLYTRYGENVLETTQNPAWTCPACRGICNCSRCRRAKGWPPVNILYPKVAEAGYKSVAHYLILTRCAGAMAKASQEGTEVVDLTQGDTEAPLRYEGSDTSANWSESDDDDDSDDDIDSKTKKKTVDQSVEEHVGTEPSRETVDLGADDDYKNQGFNEPHLATAQPVSCP